MKNLIHTTLFIFGCIVISSANAAGNPSVGEPLTTLCAACHGADGNSPGPAYPKLAGLGEKYLLKQLTDIKSGTRVFPEMTGMLDSLSDQNLRDIAAYYASKEMQLSGAKAVEVQINTGEKVDSLALGAKVYRSGNLETKVPACSGCHSPRGKGNDPAGYPRIGGQYAEYIEKQLLQFRKGDRTNDGESMVMRGVAEHMSDAEISAVANFIAGLH